MTGKPLNKSITNSQSKKVAALQCKRERNLARGNSKVKYAKVEKNQESYVCRNCNTSFQGKFCSNCGQAHSDFERPLRFLLIDLFGTMIAFDTRLLKTLGAILFKPGKLTKDFISGKRIRYMPPFRFYIFISFVMFFLMNTVIKKSVEEGNNNLIEVGDTEKKKDVDIVEFVRTTSILDNSDPVNVVIPDSGDASLNIAELDESQSGNISTKEEDVKKDKNKERTKLISEHPEIFISKFLRFFSYSLFLLMPIFAFFMWLLFLKSGKYYITHFLFSLNIHSFLFVLLSIIILTNLIFSSKTIHPEYWLLLLVPVYHAIGVRKIYGTGWFKTILSGTIAWSLYIILILIAVISIIVLTYVNL